MKIYKNWKEICQVARYDKLLMLVLASAPDEESEFVTSRLRQGFPECFSLSPVDGPFPLSVIRELAQEEGRKQGAPDGADYPDVFDIPFKLDIPIVLLELATAEDAESEWPLYPPEEGKKLKQGDVMEWKEKEMVVLENNQGKGRTGRLCVAPAECIALDL